MRTIEDLYFQLDNMDNTDRLSSYDTLSPLYDFINSRHFNYKNQERIAKEITNDESTLIECGCGTGILLSKLQDTGRELIGFDLNRGMIKRANYRTNRNVSLVLGDIRMLPLANINADGCLILGRVFSKILSDKDARDTLNNVSKNISSSSKIVFNTFCRDDLIDNMTKEQMWEDNNFKVIRESSTDLKNQEEGYMNITMNYKIYDKDTDNSVRASETFDLRGYNRSDIDRICPDNLDIINVKPNNERSTIFFKMQKV